MSRILGLDVSTKTIGISLFEDLGDNGKSQKRPSSESGFEDDLDPNDLV